MAVPFTSLLPQFIASGTDPLPGLPLLGRAFNLLALLWLVGFACAVACAAPAPSHELRGWTKQALSPWTELRPPLGAAAP